MGRWFTTDGWRRYHVQTSGYTKTINEAGEPMLRRDLLGVMAGTALAVSSSGQAESNKTQKRIKIGQIGTRHAHASGQIATMQKLSDLYEVVGVVEPDVAQRKRAVSHKAYQNVKWLTEEQLLNTPGLELVAVETEVKDLLATARRCVAAGKHIHLDKPAGASMSDLKKLHAAARQQDLMIQMGYMFRYNFGFQFLYRAVRQGWLGNVFEIHGVMSKTMSAASRKALDPYPGGTMFELGCHLIDPLLNIMGPPDHVTHYIRKTRPEQDQLNDNMLAVFEYPRATATIRTAAVEVDGIKRRQFVVCGDEGTIVIRPLEPPRLELTLSRARGDYQRGTHIVTLPNSPGRYDGAFIDMFRVIRGVKDHDFSHEHDLAVQHSILLASNLPI